MTLSRARKKNPSPAKKSREQHSNSTKVTALNMLKRGDTQVKVARDLKVSERTLRRWKEDSIAAGKWDGPGGDGLARPAERRKDPGTGTKNRKITDEIKKVIKRKLRFNPFLTAYGLQQCIPELANISQRTIMHCVAKELKLPSRIAAKKPFLTPDQKARRLAWALRHCGWSRVKWAKVLWSDETHIEQWVSASQCQRRVHIPIQSTLCSPNNQARKKADDLGLLRKLKARETLLCCS